MRQGRQVAGGADRSLFGYDGNYIFLQVPEHSLQGRQLDARITFGQGMDLGDEHQPGDACRDGRSHPDTMTL